LIFHGSVPFTDEAQGATWEIVLVVFAVWIYSQSLGESLVGFCSAPAQQPATHLQQHGCDPGQPPERSRWCGSVAVLPAKDEWLDFFCISVP